MLFTRPQQLQPDSCCPAVTTVGEYDLETPFGFDFTWHGLTDRVTYSEDALNTWDAANPHKVRVYPLKNADGTVEPNAYIVAPEDVPTGVDFQDAVFIVRNVKPAVTSGAGKLTANPAELVFSAVQRHTSRPRQTVTVTNNGTTPLDIAAVTLAGTNAGVVRRHRRRRRPLAVGGSRDLHRALQPGDHQRLGTQSAASAHRLRRRRPRPTIDIGLYGLATPGEQGNNEPPLEGGRRHPRPHRSTSAAPG